MNDSPAQAAANFVGLVAYLFVVGGDWSLTRDSLRSVYLEKRASRRPIGPAGWRSNARALRRKTTVA